MLDSSMDEDAGLGEGAVGQHTTCRRCNSSPGTPMSMSAMAQQADGDLLAGGADLVEFAWIRVAWTSLARAMAVGFAAHRGNHDHHLMAWAWNLATQRLATFLIRQGLPTEVPPYF